MNSAQKVFLGLFAFVGLAAAPACQSGFPDVVQTQRLDVTITSANTGEPDSRLDISFANPSVFTVDIQALDASGNLDTSFNGYIRTSVVPGTVLSVSADSTYEPTGRNVRLRNGQAKGIQISVLDVYGDANIWVEDVGYVPADPLRVPPPQCANGIDDNKNGKVDYPVDPGCYAANDDTEDGGTYAAAATDTMYFKYPKIADVRGISNGGSVTPFNNQQVEIDTGWVAPNAPGGVVITGVSSSGFYVTDIGNLAQGFASVYAYNYTAPPIMLPCDRLVTFGGTAGDFYGYTEINFPTWSLEEWNPTVRPCLVPPPVPLLAGDLASVSAQLLNLEAALVEVAHDTTVATVGTSTISVATTAHIGALFGPGLVNQATYQPTADATDCDYNADGKIEYDTNCGPNMDQPCPEDLCANNCQANVECTEYSGFLTESQFRLVVETATTTTPKGGKPTTSTVTGTIEGNGSADANFNPEALKGQQLRAFAGNLIYFSGGSQFTIQARCADDIVTDLGQTPLPSDKACVVQRNAADLTNAN
jgi:hypothetical protein